MKSADEMIRGLRRTESLKHRILSSVSGVTVFTFLFVGKFLAVSASMSLIQGEWQWLTPSVCSPVLFALFCFCLVAVVATIGELLLVSLWSQSP